MSKLLASLALGLVLSIAGCNHNDDHMSSKPADGMKTADACPKCAGMQTATADGKCPVCDKPVGRN